MLHGTGSGPNVGSLDRREAAEVAAMMAAVTVVLLAVHAGLSSVPGIAASLPASRMTGQSRIPAVHMCARLNQAVM